jgi:hypothetical protein
MQQRQLKSIQWWFEFINSINIPFEAFRGIWYRWYAVIIPPLLNDWGVPHGMWIFEFSFSLSMSQVAAHACADGRTRSGGRTKNYAVTTNSQFRVLYLLWKIPVWYMVPYLVRVPYLVLVAPYFITYHRAFFRHDACDIFIWQRRVTVTYRRNY